MTGARQRLSGLTQMKRWCRRALYQLATAPKVLLADVFAVVDAQPEPVALVGRSLGGLLALRAAVARPDRVWALVLEDPARPAGGSHAQPGLRRRERGLP